MKKENYYSLTVWGILLLLLCVFPFRLHAQGKTLSRLQAPRDSVQQPVKLSQASRAKKVGTSSSILTTLQRPIPLSVSKTGELPKLDVDGCAAQCAL